MDSFYPLRVTLRISKVTLRATGRLLIVRKITPIVLKIRYLKDSGNNSDKVKNLMFVVSKTFGDFQSHHKNIKGLFSHQRGHPVDVERPLKNSGISPSLTFKVFL